MCDSYASASNAEMDLNDRGAAVMTSPDQILLPDTNTLAKYMSMEIPKTLPYSIPGPNADIFFKTKVENEKHKEISRHEGQNGTTTATKYRLDAWEESNDGLLDDYSWSIESVQTTQELDNSFFSDNSSQHSSQTEVDEEELRIDHPLMGKDAGGIQESFVAVKSSEFDAYPPKVFYRSGVSMILSLISYSLIPNSCPSIHILYLHLITQPPLAPQYLQRPFSTNQLLTLLTSQEPQVWEWAPSNLRCCQTVVRDEGSTYKI